MVPSLANPNTIKVNSEHLWMTLQSCPEVSAVLQKVRWSNGPSFIGCFEAMAESTTGRLKTASDKGGYSIDENDLKTAEFSSYYLPKEDSKEAITIEVVEEITDKKQIVISAGGKYQISSDLVGKNIKVQVLYPHTVQLTETPIETLRVHMVGKWEDGSVKAVTIRGCSYSPMGGSIQLDCKDREVEVLNLLEAES